jgi:succinate dehydrogenase flavin-adding protein (antitoxin of CptAB toxin-antitoxin module)
MTALDLEQFEDLLDQPDHDLQAWILGAAEPPPVFNNAMLGRLRAFVPKVPSLIAAGR